MEAYLSHRREHTPECMISHVAANLKVIKKCSEIQMPKYRVTSCLKSSGLAWENYHSSSLKIISSPSFDSFMKTETFFYQFCAYIVECRYERLEFDVHCRLLFFRVFFLLHLLVIGKITHKGNYLLPLEETLLSKNSAVNIFKKIIILAMLTIHHTFSLM